MFGSLFIGLSGMNAYSNGLRQVSNNITNLNSTGYRASDVGFSDLFRGGSRGMNFVDGSTSQGSGVALANARIDFSEGEIRQSDRDLDLAVEGDGFLVLERDGQFSYARTGSFEVNDEGFVVLSGTDYKLTYVDEAGQPQAIEITDYRTSRPQATTEIVFSDNLSSTADDHTISNVTAYNSEGEAISLTLRFARDTDAITNSWTVTVENSDGDTIGEAQDLEFIAGALEGGETRLSIEDEDSKLDFELVFDENVTSFSSGSISTLRASDVDGFAIGEITTIRVNEEGAMELTYSNGETEEIGDVTLAAFQNLQDLQQTSGGIFTYDNVGGREFLTSDSERVGQVLSNRIEASNVNLSDEFGDLILVQRGYQASSQVVSVSNDMIQQLFGIRGQG